MLNIDFFNPVKIISGAGCFRSFSDYAAFGSRCLIVCGKTSARKCGALADAEASLAKAGVTYKIFDKIEQNPLITTVYEGGRIARDWNADFILAIGGGSPLDAGKAVAAYAANPEMQPEELFNAARKPALPLLAVNTTAGTGSEVTPYSILTVPSIENKRSFSGDDIYAKIAFCDPTYTETLPRAFTMSTAVDALCHAVEGYFMKKANPVSDALAEKAITLLQKGIRAVISNNLSFETRETLLYGSTLAGMVISRTGTGFVHSTGYMLTYHHGIPHGQANAYFLPDFVRYMSAAAPERAARVYALCGVADSDGLAALLASCDDMPLDFKLTDEQCVKYADKTISAKNVEGGVRVISRDDLLAILRSRLG
ncbi:MAG: alcohol dehydrogenase [Clostridiales bacterium]|nr:MAG: alcohol dehydrogenase [Clostridiales bacterium]